MPCVAPVVFRECASGVACLVLSFRAPGCALLKGRRRLSSASRSRLRRASRGWPDIPHIGGAGLARTVTIVRTSKKKGLPRYGEFGAMELRRSVWPILRKNKGLRHRWPSGASSARGPRCPHGAGQRCRGGNFWRTPCFARRRRRAHRSSINRPNSLPHAIELCELSGICRRGSPLVRGFTLAPAQCPVQPGRRTGSSRGELNLSYSFLSPSGHRPRETEAPTPRRRTRDGYADRA
jgi:hypothetical protein